MKTVSSTVLLAVALVGAATGYWAYQYNKAHASRISAGAMPPFVPAATPTSPTPQTPAILPGITTSDTSATSTSGTAIPDFVPDVSLPDLAGQRHALRDNSGRPHLFNFWATWCEPCRREIPLLNRVQTLYPADHLLVVGIAVDFRASVRDFLKTTKLNYGLRVGEDEGLDAAQKFGMELALPFSVFADGSNRIVAIKVGELHPEDVEAILGAMRALKAGKITLRTAQLEISKDLERLSRIRIGSKTQQSSEK